MIGFEVDIDGIKALDATEEQLRQLPSLVRVVIGEAVSKNQRGFLADLRTEPGKPIYPLAWTSARQRRFVMAKLRREGNLPYQRRPAGIGSGYEIDVVVVGEFETSVVLRNEFPEERFVKGKDQQRFHAITGWIPRESQVAFWGEAIVDDVDKGLHRAFHEVN